MSSSLSPTQELGQHAEAIVAFWLEKQGASILARNYHTRYGELDLIIQEEELLTFVEVRSRTRASTHAALHSIGHSKRSRLLKAAQLYITQHYPDYEPRIAFACVGVSFRWDGSIVCRRETLELW